MGSEDNSLVGDSIKLALSSLQVKLLDITSPLVDEMYNITSLKRNLTEADIKRVNLILAKLNSIPIFYKSGIGFFFNSVSFLYNKIHDYEIYEKNKRIIELTKDVEEKQKLELHNKMIIKVQEKKLNKLLKQQRERNPKSKKNEDLIKHFIDTALLVKEYPTMRQLNNDLYSSSSYSRKLKDVIFVSNIINEIKKRLNNNKLSKDKKDILINVNLGLNKKLKKLYDKENIETNYTSKKKPDYKENLIENDKEVERNEIQEMFDSLVQ